MSLSFPTGPTNGQQTTTGGRTYQWNGQAWTLVGNAVAGGAGVSAIVALSQSAYDALSPKVATTLYIVTPNP